MAQQTWVTKPFARLYILSSNKQCPTRSCQSLSESLSRCLQKLRSLSQTSTKSSTRSWLEMSRRMITWCKYLSSASSLPSSKLSNSSTTNRHLLLLICSHSQACITATVCKHRHLRLHLLSPLQSTTPNHNPNTRYCPLSTSSFSMLLKTRAWLLVRSSSSSKPLNRLANLRCKINFSRLSQATPSTRRHRLVASRRLSKLKRIKMEIHLCSRCNSKLRRSPQRIKLICSRWHLKLCRRRSCSQRIQALSPLCSRSSRLTLLCRLLLRSSKTFLPQLSLHKPLLSTQRTRKCFRQLTSLQRTKRLSQSWHPQPPSPNLCLLWNLLPILENPHSRKHLQRSRQLLPLLRMSQWRLTLML